jgi:hypothetical protein
VFLKENPEIANEIDQRVREALGTRGVGAGSDPDDNGDNDD